MNRYRVARIIVWAAWLAAMAWAVFTPLTFAETGRVVVWVLLVECPVLFAGTHLSVAIMGWIDGKEREAIIRAVHRRFGGPMA